MNQSSLQNLRHLEMKSEYYQEMIDGLKVFEKIERNFEEIEFLFKQHNVLAAATLYSNLNEMIKYNEQNKAILQEFGVMDMMKKRLQEKQRMLNDLIT